jgi:hypothetical protein
VNRGNYSQLLLARSFLQKIIGGRELNDINHAYIAGKGGYTIPLLCRIRARY